MNKQRYVLDLVVKILVSTC